MKIAYGTDSGVSRHGINAREAVLMAEAGMPEMEIIKSATVNAADLLDMSSSIGTIEAGKFADIIAVDNSPLDNIEAGPLRPGPVTTSAWKMQLQTQLS